MVKFKVAEAELVYISQASKAPTLPIMQLNRIFHSMTLPNEMKTNTLFVHATQKHFLTPYWQDNISCLCLQNPLQITVVINVYYELTTLWLRFG